MTTTAVTPTTARAACDARSRVTKSLLGYGVLAGPFYVVLVIVQALIRPGFDLTRHDVSLLSNGSLGWIQVVTFIATGAMVLAFATGVGRALRTGRAATWGPRLVGLFGAGLVGAGVFVADPMNGFPAGAPAGMPATLSVHGLLHLACAGVGFAGIAAACIVLARRFAAEGSRGLARASGGVGVAFLLGFFGLASGSSSRAVVLVFWAVLIALWTWMAVVAVHLYRREGATVDGA